MRLFELHPTTFCSFEYRNDSFLKVSLLSFSFHDLNGNFYTIFESKMSKISIFLLSVKYNSEEKFREEETIQHVMKIRDRKNNK